MTYFRPTTFLRGVLAVDALSCAAMGLGLAAGANIVAGITALPVDLLRYAGIALIPCAAYLAFIASRESLPRLAVWAVIVLNGLWVVESLVTLMSSAVAPNALGYAFVIVQAAFVAVLAELEYVGLKRSESAPVAA